MKPFTTRQAAKKLGIGLMTLNRYIAARKIRVPKVKLVSGRAMRAWTDRDIERVRKQLTKIANGRRKENKRKKAKKLKKQKKKQKK